MEAIWVAAEMRAGGAYAHSVIALDALGGEDHDQRGKRGPVMRPELSMTSKQEA
jgi:hypothetical protein